MNINLFRLKLQRVVLLLQQTFDSTTLFMESVQKLIEDYNINDLEDLYCIKHGLEMQKKHIMTKKLEFYKQFD